LPHPLAGLVAKHTRGTRMRIKTRKIGNKNFYSPYSNETFYMTTLEYKADFTLTEQIVKLEFGRYSSFFCMFAWR
jgi:hypothetical protein